MFKMRTILALSSAAVAVAAAFQNESGWKTDASGKIETDDNGNPLYVDDKGQETSVRYDTAIQLRGEAKSHRQRAEAAERELKKFEGIDPVAARDAIEKVKDVDFTKLVDAGKIEEVKQQMKSQFENDIRDREERATKLQRENDNLRLDNAFKSSTFLNERLAVPADAAKALYRDQFKIEDGKVVPLNANGDPIYSKRNAGEIASVDEAFEILITSRPDKDNWIKAPEAGGSGSGGAGGARGNGKAIKRADFNALPPGQQAQVGQKVAAGEMSVVD